VRRSWPRAAATDHSWYDVVLTHAYARQETQLYVDGVLAGSLRESLEPAAFVLGGSDGADGRRVAPTAVDLQDVALYRAGWTGAEVAAQHGGQFQQASLEVLSALDESSFGNGGTTLNTAQSFSAFSIASSQIVAQAPEAVPGNLVAESYAEDAVRLSWTDPSSNESAFILERRSAGTTEPWAEVAVVPADSTSYTDSTVGLAERYAYRISVLENGAQGDYSPTVTVAVGQDGLSYRGWAGGHFALAPALFRIDFNLNAAPAYNGEIWNQVDDLADPGSYLLRDTAGDASAGYRLNMRKGFDDFRSNNGSPLADTIAPPQESLFVVTDSDPAEGAELRFSGLNPDFSYDFSLFGRRGTVISGFDYAGTVTLAGAGPATRFPLDVAMADSVVEVFGLRPDAAGTITLTVSAAEDPSGSVFAGLSFLTLREVTPPGAFLVDLNAGFQPSYPAGTVWNTVSDPFDTTTIYPLVTALGDGSDGVTLRLSAAFRDERENDANPPGSGTTGVAESSLFVGSLDGGGSALVFRGLSLDRRYDLIFLGRRGSAVAGFDYTGVYTVTGDSVTSRIVDAAGNDAFTTFADLSPSSAGELEIRVESGPGEGSDFPVLNLILLRPAGYVPGKAPLSAPDDDPEGDGRTNFGEYAIGLDPLLPDGAGLPVALLPPEGDSALVFTYPRDEAAREAVLWVESTLNLTDPNGWSLAEMETTVIERQGTRIVLRVESTSLPVGSAPRFYRLSLQTVAE
jgi:hypothetical protein